MPAVAPPDPPLSDGVVHVRAWSSADAPAVTRACQDPDIARWTLVPEPYTESHALAFIASASHQMAGGVAAPLAVAASGDDALLGAIGLNVIDWERRAADVGYWVAPPARGRGVAVRAVDLIARWAFDTLGLEHLDLRPHRDNEASQRVALRAGFVPVEEALTRRTSGNGPDMLAFARRAA